MEYSQHTVYLSRRNLEILLNKLDRLAAGEDTACAIIKYRNNEDKYQQTMDSVMVVAIPDSEAYAARQPGGMHPADEIKFAPTIR